MGQKTEDKAKAQQNIESFKGEELDLSQFQTGGANKEVNELNKYLNELLKAIKAVLITQLEALQTQAGGKRYKLVK
jgi:hypothetical protein